MEQTAAALNVLCLMWLETRHGRDRIDQVRFVTARHRARNRAAIDSRLKNKPNTS